MSSKRKAKGKKQRTGPKTRDKHRLYEIAVQSPRINLRFCDRVYKKKNGVSAAWLKEDFCGTALTSVDWVKMRSSNRAVGVDLDLEPMRRAVRAVAIAGAAVHQHDQQSDQATKSHPQYPQALGS